MGVTKLKCNVQYLRYNRLFVSSKLRDCCVAGGASESQSVKLLMLEEGAGFQWLAGLQCDLGLKSQTARFLMLNFRMNMTG